MKNELLTIGPFTVYGYGLMIAIGILAGCLTAEYRAGDTIKITILRDGEEKELQVQLGSYSE